MWPSRHVLAAIAGTCLSLAAAAPGPLPPPPPIHQQPPPLSPPSSPPNQPPAPLPSDPNLRLALTTLDELDALVAELRNADDTGLKPQQFKAYAHEISECRTAIQRQAEKVRAGGDEESARLARSVIHWVSEASGPLHQARLVRLRSETAQLRTAAEHAFADLERTTLDGDNLPGEVAQLHRQARIWWDEGNYTAAAGAYQRLQTAITDAHQEAAAREEARSAQVDARLARDKAQAVQAERFAASSWHRAVDLVREADAAFAHGDYRSSRSSANQAVAVFEQAMTGAAPACALAKAQARYDAVALGLEDADLEKLGGEDRQIAGCLDNARDDSNAAENRAASYDEGTQLLLALRLREAKAILVEKPDSALDHLAAVLSVDAENTEARDLFNGQAHRRTWWLTQAKLVSQTVAEPHYRLSLYGLLARTRRLLGDTAGAAQARGAAIALLQQQATSAWVPPPVFDLLPEFAAAHDTVGYRRLLAAARTAAPPVTDIWRRALWLAQLSGFAERGGETRLAQTLADEASALLPGHEPWVAAIAAASANKHAAARQHWRELAEQARDSSRKISQEEVVDLGGRLLQAAAEAGDEAGAMAFRAELLAAAAKVSEDMATAIAWRVAVTDACARQWADIPGPAAPDWTTDRLCLFALLRARQGELGTAIDLLSDAPGPEALFACWQIAAAWSASDHLSLVDLFAWVEALPNAECRCAAFLGAASSMTRTDPAGSEPMARKR